MLAAARPCCSGSRRSSSAWSKQERTGLPSAMPTYTTDEYWQTSSSQLAIISSALPSWKMSASGATARISRTARASRSFGCSLKTSGRPPAMATHSARNRARFSRRSVSRMSVVQTST